MMRQVLLCTLLTTGAAIAQPPEQREARSQFERGMVHFNLGEYDQAIEAFRAAYALSNEPAMLYNIAQSYRLQGRGACVPAVRFYETFLRLQPDTPLREAVKHHVDALGPCAQQEQGQPAPEPAPAPAPAPRAASPRRWPLIAASGGAVATVAGGVLLGSASNDFAQAQASCAPFCAPERGASIQRRAALGVTAATVGLGTVGAAALVYWLHAPSAPAAYFVVPSIEQRALVVGGRW